VDIVSGAETRPSSSENTKAVRAFIKKQQLACAKIILSIEMSQLPHTRYDDPTEIWESLEQVHHAHGFATRLALHRRSLYMHKKDDQTMNSWISDIKNAAFQLEAAGVAVIDEDMILALTEGLPGEFTTLIITLDNILTAELTLVNIITHLLNEEVPQVAESAAKNARHHALAIAKKKPLRPIEEIMCYNCNGKGHYQVDCPLPKRAAAAAVDKHKASPDEWVF
jgi:gag-polypeptide of LTR copia-type/Zinc knuckle